VIRPTALALALTVATQATSALGADPVSMTVSPADPAISAMLRDVSAAAMRSSDERLVAFGTRNLFSETSSARGRGVFSARDYIARRFRAIARTSAARLSVELDTYEQAKTERTPRAVVVSSVIATLRGDEPSRGTIVMSSHYDSRNSDGNDATKDAPGADDNGSGVAAVIEAARVMARRHYAATLVFACFDGEEQGLFGSDHYAQALKIRSTVVEANLNDDIIGTPAGHDGEASPSDVRLFSEALPAGASTARVDTLGNENDSPARELARFAKEMGEAYVPDMHVRLVFRTDRFLRGGDQESFASRGYPAIRYVEPHENFDHQHQDVRVENGVSYGDRLRYVDFGYLARVTRLNVAALATLALAPAAPKPTLAAKRLEYVSTLAWPAVPRAVSYRVLARRTDEMTWTRAFDAGTATTLTVPLSKDDWLFAVSAIDAQGHRSVAAFPTPVRD